MSHIWPEMFPVICKTSPFWMSPSSRFQTLIFYLKNNSTKIHRLHPRTRFLKRYDYYIQVYKVRYKRKTESKKN